MQYSRPGQLAVPRGVGDHLSLPGAQWLDASTCPQAVVFSRAPGGWQSVQEPGWALSVVSETVALHILTRLVTIYLNLKSSNSRVPYQDELCNFGLSTYEMNEYICSLSWHCII